MDLVANESSLDNSWHICCADDYELEKMIGGPMVNDQVLVEDGPNKEAESSKVEEDYFHHSASVQEGRPITKIKMTTETTNKCNLADEECQSEQFIEMIKTEFAANWKQFVQEKEEEWKKKEEREEENKQLVEELRIWKHEAEKRIKHLEEREQDISLKINNLTMSMLVIIGLLFQLLLVGGSFPPMFSTTPVDDAVELPNTQQDGFCPQIHSGNVADPSDQISPNDTKYGSGDVSTLERGLIYVWNDWKLIRSENSIFIWSDTFKMEFSDSSNGYLFFFMNGLFGILYCDGSTRYYDENAGILHRQLFIDDFHKANTAVRADALTKSVWSVPRASQPIQFGNWNLSSVEAGTMLATNRLCTRQDLIIKEDKVDVAYRLLY